MTMHTYTMVFEVTIEAETPVQAALAGWSRMERWTAEEDSWDLVVKQFVDTDVPPKIYDVDLDIGQAARRWLSPEQVKAWRIWHGLLP